MGCGASVEAELRDVDGVRAIGVELTNQSATVIFDPATTEVTALRNALGRVGYMSTVETVVEG